MSFFALSQSSMKIVKVMLYVLVNLLFKNVNYSNSHKKSLKKGSSINNVDMEEEMGSAKLMSTLLHSKPYFL